MNNITFTSIVTPPLLEIKPTQLTELARGITTNQWLPPELPPGITIDKYSLPRSLTEILQDLTDNRQRNITLLEWIHCIYNKQRWDEQQPQTKQIVTTSKLIWREANVNRFLLKILCSLLITDYEYNREKLAKSLRDTFPTLVNLQPENLIVQITNYRKQERFDQIAQLCQQHYLTPKQILSQAELPLRLPNLFKNTYNYIASNLTIWKSTTQKQVDWFLACLDEMELNQEIKAVESLLNNFSTSIDSQLLKSIIEWLSNNYNSQATGSKYHQLSPTAKQNLRKLLGLGNYRNFETLVDIILNKLSLEHWEANQLEARKYFWSHYSDRFENIRILLPQSSLNAIGNQLQKPVDILEDDGSDPTEICIFDFGDWFVVEFFRSSGSETRLFNRFKHSDIKTKLFDSASLSVKKLRRLGGDVQDHRYLWQYYCEQSLRQKGILPNEGITSFRINSTFFIPYNPRQGLPFKEH